MGTEILIFFAPIPLMFWGWDLWQIAIKNKRLHWIYLLSGVVYMAYFCLPISTKQYFIQGLLFGGLFYIPFYLLMITVVSMFKIGISQRKKA